LFEFGIALFSDARKLLLFQREPGRVSFFSMPVSETITASSVKASTADRLLCAHCGARCPDDRIADQGHLFCCHGCLTVYQLLTNSGLDRFYDLQNTPGVRMNQAPASDERFAYLEDAAVQTRLLDFTDGRVSRVTFRLPAIHCLACVWLLENLFRLHPAIGPCQVNFPRKEVALSFDPRQCSLRGVVELLTSIGYEPTLNLGAGPAPLSRLREERSLWLKIGLAGFAFGNIMMLSLPSYLGMTAGDSLRPFFGWLSLGLAVPVLLYSASDYFRQSCLGLRRGALTIDFPIALGVLALFGQSAYDVISGASEGYFDSFSGLIFFLLCGRWFQQRSYDLLSFDRDYRSYFPLSVRRREPEGDRAVPVLSLRVGDRIVLRHQEIVPADSRLLTAEARLDYSFVTGEAEPVVRRVGETIYAGGRQIGAAIELEILKETSQSYLTSLWNCEAFRKNRDQSLNNLTNRASRWFTALILILATAAAVGWALTDPTRATRAFVATLIVACPCALALAAPFALGSALRRLGRHRFFLKNADTVEQLARINIVVFDKTGTLTKAGEVRYTGTPLTAEERRAVRAVAAHSTHPLSRSIAGLADEVWPEVTDFREATGRGVSGCAGGLAVALGSAEWLRENGTTGASSGTAVAVNGVYRGFYLPDPSYRTDLTDLVRRLATHFQLAVLSGDSDREADRLRDWFGSAADLRFQQQPADKMEAVREKQAAGASVLMLGDGLNDAGALRQADVGVAVTDDIASFSPACDAILDAAQLERLPELLDFTRRTVHVIYACFALSIVYNAAGLSFAMRGMLSPVISAVLMPLSSVTIVAFALLATRWAAWRSGLRGTRDEGRTEPS
jgi:Cu+-exporting ATPase